MSGYLKYFVISFVAAFVVSFAYAASADVEVISGDTTVTVTGKARASGLFDNAGNGFSVGNARLGAGVSKGILDADLSFQYDGSDFNLLGASASASLYKDYVNVTAGRFLVPAGKNAMDDIYGTTEWNGTSVIAKWASPQETNRGDGVAVAGSAAVGGGVDVAYNVGVFDGGAGDALIAARADVSIASVEGLAIGIVVQSQGDAVGAGNDYLGWGLDASYSRSLSPGLLTVSGAYNHYDLDGAAYVPTVGLNAGDGFTVGASMLLNASIPSPIAVQAEPFVRYQRFSYADGVSGSTDRVDLGANFEITELAGSKLALNYFHEESLDLDNNDGFIIGLQFEF
jgi:hypothetical protein